jgi:hypothetical protein
MAVPPSNLRMIMLLTPLGSTSAITQKRKLAAQNSLPPQISSFTQQKDSVHFGTSRTSIPHHFYNPIGDLAASGGGEPPWRPPGGHLFSQPEDAADIYSSSNDGLKGRRASLENLLNTVHFPDAKRRKINYSTQSILRHALAVLNKKSEKPSINFEEALPIFEELATAHKQAPRKRRGPDKKPRTGSCKKRTSTVKTSSSRSAYTSQTSSSPTSAVSHSQNDELQNRSYSGRSGISSITKLRSPSPEPVLSFSQFDPSQQQQHAVHNPFASHQSLGSTSQWAPLPQPSTQPPPSIQRPVIDYRFPEGNRRTYPYSMETGQADVHSPLQHPSERKPDNLHQHFDAPGWTTPRGGWSDPYLQTYPQ